jgi:hypothetical protein
VGTVRLDKSRLQRGQFFYRGIATHTVITRLALVREDFLSKDAFLHEF